MKNKAEVEALSPTDIVCCDETALGVFSLERIKQIQLDAMQEGMRRAAGMAGQDAIIQPSNDALQLLIKRKEAILAAAEQLTDKDL